MYRSGNLIDGINEINKTGNINRIRNDNINSDNNVQINRNNGEIENLREDNQINNGNNIQTHVIRINTFNNRGQNSGEEGGNNFIRNDDEEMNSN